MRSSAIACRMLEQAVLSILLSLLFGAALIATDTLGLGALVVAASHQSGSSLIVMLGAMTGLAPIIMATQVWSLGVTGD